MFGTLHTPSAAQTIDRIVDAHPSDQRRRRNFLADNLQAVVTQELVSAGRPRPARRRRGDGRESPFAQLIREQTHQIPAQLHRQEPGMQLMDQALLTRSAPKRIDPDDAYRYATDRKSSSAS